MSRLLWSDVHIRFRNNLSLLVLYSMHITSFGLDIVTLFFSNFPDLKMAWKNYLICTISRIRMYIISFFLSFSFTITNPFLFFLSLEQGWDCEHKSSRLAAGLIFTFDYSRILPLDLILRSFTIRTYSSSLRARKVYMHVYILLT